MRGYKRRIGRNVYILSVKTAVSAFGRLGSNARLTIAVQRLARE
jgi:hypothetical protein